MPSPIKISKVRIKDNVKKVVRPIHGLWGLFLPCDNSSPNDAVPAGRPKPRKSNEVKIITELLSINGINVKAATMLFGNICFKIILDSFTPIAFADKTYSNFLPLRNSTLTGPTNVIQLNNVIISNSHQKLGIMKVAIIIKIKIVGKPDQISINLCINKSNAPPKYPEAAPIKTPMMELMIVKNNPKIKEILNP